MISEKQELPKTGECLRQFLFFVRAPGKRLPCLHGQTFAGHMEN